METLKGAAWVALGGVFGGMARYWLSGFIARRVGETFPWGTTVVNVSGAFAVGILAAAAADLDIPGTAWSWQLAVTGFLGCYTTVSSFSLQTLALARDGERGRALGNMALSLSLCLGGVALGYATGLPVFK